MAFGVHCHFESAFELAKRRTHSSGNSVERALLESIQRSHNTCLQSYGPIPSTSCKAPNKSVLIFEHEGWVKLA